MNILELNLEKCFVIPVTRPQFRKKKHLYDKSLFINWIFMNLPAGWVGIIICSWLGTSLGQ